MRNISGLICEILDDKPLCFKGYQEVLSGKKTVEEVRGSGSLKSLIAGYLTGLVGKLIDENKFTVLAGRPGVHLDRRDNVSSAIAIFDQAVLPGAKISRKYVDVPPKIAIGIDIDADVTELTETGYIHKKTRKLLQFGVEKIIWVLTEAQVVMVATADRIETFDWHRDIELMDGQLFNIGG